MRYRLLTYILNSDIPLGFDLYVELGDGEELTRKHYENATEVFSIPPGTITPLWDVRSPAFAVKLPKSEAREHSGHTFHRVRTSIPTPLPGPGQA